ncbi:MAG: hypothetical protein KKF46_04075 [Nanoarchaeota archaeon]|nr:hypothetical protein [Nanoarchaeota archaeon]MBU1321512.1 hypothetical protein [Nanoarchaeota archaeon]MBU1597129.1 hypothetical protein [Nanoarchaeota archaeon]MBU2441537.1 hypothetical protein [Nanoarchaeota archaeon]
MGKEKYIRNVESLFKKSPVIADSSITRLVRSSKKVKQYHRQLIRNLILKGKIKRLVKGFYTIHDNPSLAVFCFKPAYLGLQDALSFHELWEQETIPVIITAKKIRQGIRNILGMNVLIRRIDKKYVFGFDYHEQGGIYFPYSDIEKTFIDIIYFKDKISDETKEEIVKKIDNEKLNHYLKAYPARFRKTVLGLRSK